MTILNADMKVFDWKGDEVVENPPAQAIVEALTVMGKSHKLQEVLALIDVKNPKDGLRPVTVGALLAPYVAQGTGLEEKDSVACYVLASALHAGGDVELSNADSELIKQAVNNSPTVQRWVKGLVHYLLDPDGVPENKRKIFKKNYEPSKKVN